MLSPEKEKNLQRALDVGARFRHRQPSSGHPHQVASRPEVTHPTNVGPVPSQQYASSAPQMPTLAAVPSGTHQFGRVPIRSQAFYDDHAKALMKIKGHNYTGIITSYSEFLRYEEAYLKINNEKTGDELKDWPEDDAGQNALAKRLYFGMANLENIYDKKADDNTKLCSKSTAKKSKYPTVLGGDVQDGINEMLNTGDQEDFDEEERTNDQEGADDAEGDDDNTPAVPSKKAKDSNAVIRMKKLNSFELEQMSWRLLVSHRTYAFNPFNSFNSNCQLTSCLPRSDCSQDSTDWRGLHPRMEREMVAGIV